MHGFPLGRSSPSRQRSRSPSPRRRTGSPRSTGRRRYSPNSVQQRAPSPASYSLPRGYQRVERPPAQDVEHSPPLYDVYGRRLPPGYTSLIPESSEFSPRGSEGTAEGYQRPQSAVDRLAYGYTNSHKYRAKESLEQIATIKAEHAKRIPRNPQRTSAVWGTQMAASSPSESTKTAQSKYYTEVPSSGYGVRGEYSPFQYQPRSARRAVSKKKYRANEPAYDEEKERVRTVVSKLDDDGLKKLANSLHNVLSRRKTHRNSRPSSWDKTEMVFENKEDKMKAELLANIDQLLEARESVSSHGGSVDDANRKINELLDKFADKLLTVAEAKAGTHATDDKEKQAIRESIQQRLRETLEQSATSQNSEQPPESPSPTNGSPHSQNSRITEATSTLQNHEKNINKKLEEIDAMIHSVHKASLEDIYWQVADTSDKHQASSRNTSSEKYQQTNYGALNGRKAGEVSARPRQGSSGRASNKPSERKNPPLQATTRPENDMSDLDNIARRLYESFGSQVEQEITKMKSELNR